MPISEREFAKQRQEMVEIQIKARGINDQRVLDAMLKIPRHKFIPTELQNFSYDDAPLPIGNGQTISQPFIIAQMTEYLNLKGNEKVLEIGTGSGYQTAILAEIAKKVITIERDEELAKNAKSFLHELRYTNISFVYGDGTKGYEKDAPYDRIMVTAGAPGIPKPLADQLAEGGKMVIPIGERHYQNLYFIEKINGKLKQTALGGCVFVPLIGKYGWEN